MVRLALEGDEGKLDAWLSAHDFVPCEAAVSLDENITWFTSVSDQSIEPVIWVRVGGDLRWVESCWDRGIRWAVGGQCASSEQMLERVLEQAAESPGSAWLSFVMQEQSLDVDLGCRLLTELLGQDEWGSPKDRGRLRTVAQEALTNAWEHGHGGDRTLPVEVLYTLVGGEFGLEVIDRGSGFELGDVPDPMAPENILNESGRGIYIMRSFLDELTYRDSGRHLIGRKRV